MFRKSVLIISVMILLTLIGCVSPRIWYQGDTIPLREYTLEGTGRDKVLIIPIKGVVNDERREEFLRSEPSMVQEIVSQLKKAEMDKGVKAVLLKIDSPGGTVTGSDIVYHEIVSFKERTGKKIVVSMMNVATSGAYYISLPADYIMAHPTSIIGSIGVIFIHPKLVGLMDKIGVDVEVSKSGEQKDMYSPFRETSEDESRIIQEMTDKLGNGFVDKVAQHRHLTEAQIEEISSARVYLADEALNLGLIDRIGYLSDAVSETKNYAGLPSGAKVVVYRRTKYPDDNIYNTALSQSGGGSLSLVNLELYPMTKLQAGFYYLWIPGTGAE